MKSRIINELESIGKDNDVTILYACESGSRAWGFDNAASDYDVRFIYKRNDLREYLSISQKRDVIEVRSEELDIVGWDIKKALYLHYRSNPNLREWIISPITYISWREDIFKGLPDFDPAVLRFHYTSIAVNNWKILKGSQNPSKKVIKMYLYNIRCILVWMVINEYENPPINIFDLLNQADSLDSSIENDIYNLISHYRNECRDNFNSNIIQRINQWMGKSIDSMGKEFPKKETKQDLKIYDERFFDIIIGSYESL